MPRKARIDYVGLTHHVMARTFIGLRLFCDDGDRSTFLSLLNRRINETGMRCYAWALMDTHYHLLIRTSEKPLWSLMKPLNTDYAHYYNKKYERRGALFGDRYKSIALQDQSYLERLIRYIHRNPIRAGICASVPELDKYSWTGHSVLMGKVSVAFQDTHTVLRRFGKSTAEARMNYRAFITAGEHEEETDPIERAVRESNHGKRNKTDPCCWVIGDHDFQKSVLAKDRQRRITLARYKKEGITLEHLLKAVAEKMSVSEQLILQRSKRTQHAKVRMLFCHWARECEIPTRVIGNFLGIQQAAVSHAARKGGELATDLGMQPPIV